MKTKKIFIWLAIIFVLGVLAYFFSPYLLNKTAEYLIVRDNLAKADAIVVLGGDDNGERVDEAVRLYKQGYAPHLIMSCGPLAWRLTGAEWMKKQALYYGIPEKNILMEDRSRSTLENAQFVLPILQANRIQSIILVTSPTHSRRAAWTFHRILGKDKIKIVSWPATKTSFTVKGWWTRHEDTQLVALEYISMVFYFIKGY